MPINKKFYANIRPLVKKIQTQTRYRVAALLKFTLSDLKPFKAKKNLRFLTSAMHCIKPSYGLRKLEN